MLSQSIRDKSRRSLDNRKKAKGNVKFDIEKIDDDFLANETALLGYQVRWINDKSPIGVDEKSRQIGWSWTMACRAVLRAIENKRDSVYTSYNKDSAKQFIKDCKAWSKLFNVICKIITKKVFINEENLNVFELNFPNGRSIIATAGNSENLRAKPGADIYIDEAAYRDEPLQDILAAASATLIHGGTIRIGSTHCGIDSDYNKLVSSVTEGELKYSHTKVTFREAIKQGLYKRICLRNGEEWTQEKENAWVKEIYDLYGIRAVEELDATPSDFSGGGKVFNNEMFKRVSLEEFSQLTNSETIYLRYYDLASSTDANAYYSASVKVALLDLPEPIKDGNRLIETCLVICDFEAEQLDPLEGTDRIMETVRSDSEFTFHIIEKEPGSSGSRYNAWLANELTGYLVYDYQPKISKLKRAIPASNAVAKTEIRILDIPIMTKFIATISKFDGTKKELVNDLTDCLTGAYDWFRNSNAMF